MSIFNMIHVFINNPLNAGANYRLAQSTRAQSMEELSEEQRIALEEKRQRSEKISRLMGPYLLKRYRMLNETCTVCEVWLNGFAS